MVQLSGGIGNVTTNTGLLEMAMAYSRSRMPCAAARLGIADALGDEVRSVGVPPFFKVNSLPVSLHRNRGIRWIIAENASI